MGGIFMSIIKNLISRHFKKLSSVMLSAFVMFAMTIPAYASGGGVSGSPIVTGTERLIGDVTTWLMVLAPIVAGLLIIYFCIRRSAADEMDQKKWNTRIIAAIVSCIGAIIGSATLNLIIGYYN
jgi:ABC-type molybdate transport system permease subunit